jgi:hypothetical protein
MKNRNVPILVGSFVVAGLALWRVAEAVVSVEYRRDLRGNGAQVDAGTLTHLVLDHANLVKLGKSRADGRDLLFRLISGPTVTPVDPQIGAPAGMTGYHGFDAPTLLRSPVPDCAADPNLAASWPVDAPLTSWTLCGGTAVAGTNVGNSVQEKAGQFGQAAFLNGATNTQIQYLQNKI